MIAVDTSALIAIAKNEDAAGVCQDALSAETELLISAATLAETLIVARGKKCLPGIIRLLEELPITIVELNDTRARLAAAAYGQWGRTFHRAALNFGDCFSYAVAREFDCPLLYVGGDFSRTDVRTAIAV